MNAGSLSLLKRYAIKASIPLKLYVVMPLIIFGDYLLIALISCMSCLFKAEEGFYCGPFCLAGKIILALSAIFFEYHIFTDIKAILKGK